MVQIEYLDEEDLERERNLAKATEKLALLKNKVGGLFTEKDYQHAVEGEAALAKTEAAFGGRSCSLRKELCVH